MNEKELRAKVEKRRRLTENTWQYLVDQGFVESAVYEEGNAKGRPVEYLLEAYDALADAAPVRESRAKPLGRTPNLEVVPTQLNAYEAQRSGIFSEYLAKLAAETAPVRRFRGQILRNRLLTPEQARHWLRSPFAAHNPRYWFADYRVPIVGHFYRIKERGRDEKGPYLLVETFGQTGVRTLKDKRPLETGTWASFDDKWRVREFNDVKREIDGYKVLPFPGENGATHRTLVRSASLLGRLYSAVQRLLRDYPWFEEHAVWFMLTGKPPYVAPMTVRVKHRGVHNPLGPYLPPGFSYGLVRLTVEPWVSAETVQRVYHDIQRQLLGGDNRPVGEKNRRLFSFVTERVGSNSLQPDEKRELGKELVSEWDRECSQDERRREWSYHGDTRTFWRDYNLARRLITSPEYGWSANPPRAG